MHFFVGDWLSFDRAQKALSGVANGKKPEERLNGLLPVMADFHTQMETLAITWKLFNKDTSADVGTLFSCRNIISAPTTMNPRKQYYNNGDFMDKVTSAYVLSGRARSYIVR